MGLSHAAIPAVSRRAKRPLANQSQQALGLAHPILFGSAELGPALSQSSSMIAIVWHPFPGTEPAKLMGRMRLPHGGTISARLGDLGIRQI